MMVRTLLAFAATALMACQTQSAQRDAAPLAPVPRGPEVNGIGKPQAPVDIDAALTADAARVTLRFNQAGRGVEARAEGVGGLSVQGNARLVDGRDVQAGDVVTIELPIRPGPGESHLAVHVTGRFAAGERSAVRAFPIGKRSAEQQQKADEGKARIGGEDVRILPAEEEKK
jgi:hypothetical protein